MKKLIATVLTVAAALSAPAFGNETRVPGESLDSGLGSLSATYTGTEFMNLPAGHVAGEKQDNGLGSVSAEELQRIVAKYERI
jgi:hypothetical protein